MTAPTVQAPSSSLPPLSLPLLEEALISFPEPSTIYSEEIIIKEKYQESLGLELCVAKKQIAFYQQQNLLLLAEVAKARSHIEMLNQQIFKLMAENAALATKK